MKTRAAVAFEAKKPLEIVELDLEGPKAGEVLVEIKATGICHTDAYTLDGFDSEGIFPSILGHEGAGIVREVGAGRDLGEAGRPRDPALHARMPPVQKLPQPEDQPLHRHPRHPGQGPDAGRHRRASVLQGQADLPLHGLLDVLELHRAAGDRGGEDPRGRALRQELLHRLRRHHRRRRGGQHRQGRRRAPMSSCSGSAASASTSSRAPGWSAPTRSSASTSTIPRRNGAAASA